MTKFNLLNNQKAFVNLVIILLFLFTFSIGVYVIQNPKDALSQVTHDTKAPVTTVRLVNPVKDNIFTCSAQIDITCADEVGGSGCDSVNSPKYCADKTNTCIPNNSSSFAPLLINMEGQIYLRVQSVDTAGNKEAIKSTLIIIDRTAPSMILDTTPSTVSQRHQYTWHLSGVSDVSGIGKVECYWDSVIVGSPIYAPNAGTGYACTILIPSDASTSTPHNVTAKVYDNAGWYKEDTTTVTVTPY